MANLLDYVLWRGDLTLACSPWSPVDSLLMACLSYNDLGPNAEDEVGMPLRILSPLLPAPESGASSHVRQNRELLLSMADTVRWGSIRLSDYVSVVDEAREIQFSAVTAHLPDGRVCVCFRGTDGTIVGWREDFTMSFESPVPAQMEALTYLERTALHTSGELLVTGHSKGGNLAVYAAAHADPATQARIRGVYSFDGPGLDDATFASEGYQRISSRVHAVIPQSSVVGLLLAYHPDYTVVRSSATSLLQHDPFTWQLTGPRFEELGEVDRGSQLIDQTLHEWLQQASREQRRVFVDTVFDVIEATGASTLAELSADKLRSAVAIITASREVDPVTLRMIGQLIGKFLTIGMGNLWDAVKQRPRALIEDIIEHTGGMNHG